MPQCYTKWEKDGKTKEAARTWIMQHLQNNSPAARLHPYVSDNMVNDIKALNFGQGAELTYAYCH